MLGSHNFVWKVMAPLINSPLCLVQDQWELIVHNCIEEMPQTH